MCNCFNQTFDRNRFILHILDPDTQTRMKTYEEHKDYSTAVTVSLEQDKD
jgi:hypothetical protein